MSLLYLALLFPLLPVLCPEPLLPCGLRQTKSRAPWKTSPLTQKGYQLTRARFLDRRPAQLICMTPMGSGYRFGTHLDTCVQQSSHEGMTTRPPTEHMRKRHSMAFRCPYENQKARGKVLEETTPEIKYSSMTALSAKENPDSKTKSSARCTWSRRKATCPITHKSTKPFLSLR